MKKRLALIPAAVISAFLLELIQIYTQPLGPDMAPAIHPRRIIIVTLILAAILFWMTWCRVWTSIRNTVLSGFRGMQECGTKRVILYTSAFPIGIGVSIFLFWLFCTVVAGKPMTCPRIVFAGFVGFFAVCLTVFRKTLKTQPEYLFLALMLCFGFLYSIYVPHTGLNSWDEDYHYTQALNASYVDSIVLNQQEENTISRCVPASYDLNGGIQEQHDDMDRRYGNNITEKKSLGDIGAIPEYFNGAGLFIGRALGLRYYMIHFMGRITGLIAYAFAGFFAIRKLKSGKMIAAVCLMIPTEVFIASSFNYDSYLTGFTAVGLCYYLSLWQERNAKVTLKDAIIMIGSITFGCLPKLLYIPLLWILALIPKEKFMDRKHHTWFVATLFAATVVSVALYLLPPLLHKTEVALSDTRGVGEINAGDQFRFILKNPFDFVRVVWNYLVNAYFNLSRVGETFTNLAYIGIMPNQFLYLALMIAVMFTDKNEHDRGMAHHPWVHAIPILVCFSLVIMIISSMYMVITPVGADYVEGAQFRYLIPLFLPACMHIGSGLVDNRMNRGWYNGLVFAVIAFVGFSCIYNGYICQYY